VSHCPSTLVTISTPYHGVQCHSWSYPLLWPQALSFYTTILPYSILGLCPYWKCLENLSGFFILGATSEEAISGEAISFWHHSYYASSATVLSPHVFIVLPGCSKAYSFRHGVPSMEHSGGGEQSYANTVSEWMDGWIDGWMKIFPSPFHTCTLNAPIQTKFLSPGLKYSL
jgi:hypothetical protein